MRQVILYPKYTKQKVKSTTTKYYKNHTLHCITTHTHIVLPATAITHHKNVVC